MQRRARLAAISAAAILSAGDARAEVVLGMRLEPVSLPSASGGKQPAIAPGKVNVLVFFKPGQAHSMTGLAQVARVQKGLRSRPVVWAAIASDRFSAAEVAAAAQAAGFTGAALLDPSDELYGKLEVRIHPVVIVVSTGRAVVASQPFTKLNFEQLVRARVLNALGELDDAQLQRVLNPPPALQGGEANVARRYLKMGERLLSAGDLPHALDAAHKSLDHDPTLAAAHALLGNVLAAQGKCADAAKSFAAALAIDPKDPSAQDGKKRCSAR